MNINADQKEDGIQKYERSVRIKNAEELRYEWYIWLYWIKVLKRQLPLDSDRKMANKHSQTRRHKYDENEIEWQKVKVEKTKYRIYYNML